MNDDAERNEPPRAVARIMHILGVLSMAEGGLSLAEITRQIGAPKSSVLKLLRALAYSGFVENDSGHHRLGPNSFQLAADILTKRRFPEIAGPTIRRLAEQIGETVMIAVPASNNKEFVYVAKAESRAALRYAAAIGDRRPLYASAGGMSMLAHMSPEIVRANLHRGKLKKITALTENDPKKIEAMLQDIRERGYIQTDGNISLGVAAIAAPIRGEGSMLAAIIVGIPSDRFRLARQQDIIDATVEAASEISRIMGG